MGRFTHASSFQEADRSFKGRLGFGTDKDGNMKKQHSTAKESLEDWHDIINDLQTALEQI
jgi:archaellum component FlaC